MCVELCKLNKHLPPSTFCHWCTKQFRTQLQRDIPVQGEDGDMYHFTPLMCLPKRPLVLEFCFMTGSSLLLQSLLLEQGSLTCTQNWYLIGIDHMRRNSDSGVSDAALLDVETRNYNITVCIRLTVRIYKEGISYIIYKEWNTNRLQRNLKYSRLENCLNDCSIRFTKPSRHQ